MTNRLFLSLSLAAVLIGTASKTNAFIVSGPPAPNPTTAPLDTANLWSFTFESTAMPDLNGSWIQIQNNGGSYSIVNYNLVDTDPFGGFPSDTSLELDLIFSATPTNWSGAFTALGDLRTDTGDSFTGAGSSLQANDGAAYGAVGQWVPSTATASAPDAGSTFALFVGTLAGLGIGTRLLGRKL